ncbi:MAG: hypothetical protein GYA55_07710 [SAR324 cluster bacterium]|uniref:Uncharacterized protein n=1 Tax=SAR324 cluster bacterium TaxID=2024889 RepID=A0A7X9FSJ4_9DELT|nr:hypothetical protein [SAR324 cluster bacterium]
MIINSNGVIGGTLVAIYTSSYNHGRNGSRYALTLTPVKQSTKPTRRFQQQLQQERKLGVKWSIRNTHRVNN